MDCSKITQGFTMESCTGIAIAGTAARVLLVSYSDIDKGGSTVTDNVISLLKLKQGAKAYEVDTLPDATVGSAPVTAGTYMNSFQHSVVVRIFKKSETAKKFINQLLNARVVAIVENNDHGASGETKYEVYGWDSGLKITEMPSTTEMSDQIAYQVTLASPSAGQEASLPLSLFNTDESTTDAAVESLLGAASE